MEAFQIPWTYLAIRTGWRLAESRPVASCCKSEVSSSVSSRSLNLLHDNIGS